MDSDYKIGGSWGCHVHWCNPDKEFGTWDGRQDATFSVYGHHPDIPKEGQTLTGEFANSFIQFEFISVKRCGDPADMFLAKVKPVAQISKH